MAPSRVLLSRWIARAGALCVAAVGASLYLQDGSYFLDEASVVLSFQERGVFESFAGPLAGGGQNFPRFYLLLVRGVRAIFGPETWATRLLPHAAFLAATFLWTRLLALRFGRRPALVLLGVTLIAVTPSWWFYAAVIKPYSLDVLLSLAVFSVSDRVFDETLRRRTGLWRAGVLLLPILFSYVYVIALLARLGGWLTTAWRDRGARPDPVAIGVLLAGLGVVAGVLYLTDLQHTMGRVGLVKLWGACVLSESPDETLSILRRFFAGWYEGPSEFIAHPKLPAPAVWSLLVLGALGVARVLARLGRPPSDADAWGSRSAGCLAGVVGVVASSGLLDYPICAGRLTLYAFFFQQVLILEGLDVCVSFLERGPSRTRRRLQRAVAGAAIALLIASAAWTGARVAQRVLSIAPLEDVRPALAEIPADTADPVLVTACMKRQIQTLPEGLGERHVVQLPVEGWGPLVPRGRDVWIIHSRLTPGPCEKLRRQLAGMTHGFGRRDPKDATAVVYRARVRTESELRERRREVIRALKEAEAPTSE